ncbi:hypothetical protein L228DRAFT_259154 [Xylona heveae TC161]|uniref:Uncharacterized protein n=1 Tax=Xylona heveae (strain CBS 132557 / TC161) TaxID=1328760 RepID=A0A165J5Z1_XYLHT|nr:hypothetical protein L228DRAFT_259154 [Xylona heveae TC161]KZF25778.1 hypothetical protein L228DRAFT_259154 [Xylona heveae TC161]
MSLPKCAANLNDVYEGDVSDVYFDLAKAKPGDFFEPTKINKTEDVAPVVSPNSTIEIPWFWAIKNPSHPRSRDHELDIHQQGLNYTLDLYRADRCEKVMNVMPSTNVTAFLNSGLPFGKFDGEHALGALRPINEDCPVVGCQLLVYYWTIPADIDVTLNYQMRLTTNKLHIDSMSQMYRVSNDTKPLPNSQCSKNHRKETAHTGGFVALGVVVLLCLVAVLFILWRHEKRRRARAPVKLDDAYADEDE